MGLSRNQGQQANHNGNVAEMMIDAILKAYGMEYQRHRCIGESIYGHKLYADFYLSHHNCVGGPLCIESKWQNANGSADEKFPYLVENIRQRYPCPTIVVYGGGGAKGGSIAWLESQVDGKKLLEVLPLEEFVKWASKNL